MHTSSSGNIQREFSWPVRVYWEDTDAGGVVYHASYVRFLERGRSEWLRALGIHQQALAKDRDLLFAIRAMQLDFLRAARLDDELAVRTSMKSRRGSTASPIRVLKIWSAAMASSMVTLSMRRTSGSMVVSHS